MTRLTFGAGLQTDATFSPDGRFIAYASDRAGNWDIWVQPVSGGEPVQVTRSPSQDTQPDWSPDGSTIVFRSERDGGGLYLVPALGGAEQRLTSFGTHPQWLGNGSEILFIESTSSPDQAGYSGTDVKIYITAPGRERPAEVLSEFVAKEGWYWIAGHPDGRISLYGTDPARHTRFFTVSRDGRHVAVSDYAADIPELLKGEAANIRRFRWNASGTALYVEAYERGVRNLWRVTIAPQTLRWLTAERLTTSGSDEGASALSRDGTRLAFTMNTGATRLCAFGLDATGERLVDDGRPITEDGVDATDFDLSRDGRMLAHVVERPGRPQSELWTMALDSGRGELVATNASGPRWSFDGTRLAYIVQTTDVSPFRLLVRDSTRGDQAIARLSDGTFALPLDWTPDGAAILASWRPSGSGAWAFTLWRATAGVMEKPDRVLLSDPRRSLWQGRFSPNGRWLSLVAVDPDAPGCTFGLYRAGRWSTAGSMD